MSELRIRKKSGRSKVATTVGKIEEALRCAANPAQAAILRRFFKTGPGQYGEGDIFIGLKVPVIRGVVKQFGYVPPREALTLVRSPIHEMRLAGLLLWVKAFEEGDERTGAWCPAVSPKHAAHQQLGLGGFERSEHRRGISETRG
jgi:hypothetical protein